MKTMPMGLKEFGMSGCFAEHGHDLIGVPEVDLLVSEMPPKRKTDRTSLGIPEPSGKLENGLSAERVTPRSARS